ncbi:GTP-binding protein [Ideonella sp.]|uniref:CobW family GTP-binding protein n=1 Tax=Ideonella sp. TaxID=1929293 RepID=UPI002B46865C|nr:GTP-binding protein [Ideonella sp.]HJV68847.1 GTP-binding protein [Ideonella sp.]
MNASDFRTPLTLLTGFLGSGKTSLLQRLLQEPGMADTAVIINELGEVALDHLLVDHVAENLRVLQSGCLCCTVRGDLAQTLADLAARRAAGEIAFSRVVVETTGLADPAPVLHTLVADAAVAAAYRLAGVLTTVDAVNAHATLDHHEEARRQAAMADVLLLTKTDLATPARVDRLADRLVALNPTAAQFRGLDGARSPRALLDAAGDAMAGLHRAERHAAAGSVHHHHDRAIQAHCFGFDEAVSLEAFTHWLELVAAMRGEKLLRFKGLVHIAEHPGEPLVVHGAQHVIHPPQRLPRWLSEERHTRLVFITQGMARAELERTLRKFAGVTAPI